jgi:L-lactate transport
MTSTFVMPIGWEQGYSIFGQGLGLSALIATLPILVLLFLLAVLRKPAWIAALSGLAASMVLAAVAYRMSARHIFSSAAYGASFGLFPICWIIFWALVLYEITVRTGKFEVIKESIGNITSDRRMQALLIAFAFGAFLEGCAGFGTPVAVAAAMMVGLGFSSFYASSICLLANTAPVAFGSIGIPLITLAGITGLPLNQLSASVGRICAPISLFLPAYLILVTSGWPAMVEVWPAVLVSGAAFASVQFFVSNFIGPQLTDVLSAMAAMGGLIVLLRFWTPRSAARVKAGHESGSLATSAGLVDMERPRFSRREIWLAWMPYGLLVLFVLAWGYAPIVAILNHASIAFPWPGLHNEVVRTPPVVLAPVRYGAMYNLNWLSASGTSCMFAAIFSALFSTMTLSGFFTILRTVAHKLIRPVATVASMLALAFVMNYSGATGTLGLAFSATGKLFPFFSPLMGWLGVFLTGSDTSANALFGNLQVVSAQRLGFSPVLIASANSAGGVMGKMISLQTIAVAAAATNMSTEEQSKLFRFTMRHSIFLAIVVGLEVMLYAYLRMN